MLKPALRIAAVLAALLFPSLAPAQSYELLHDGAGEKARAVCFDRSATVSYLEALHFQMTVLRKNYVDGSEAIRPRMAGRGDINCYDLQSTARFQPSPIVIDVVELKNLDAWAGYTMYGVEALRVTNQDGTVYTRQNMGDDVYVVVSDLFVRKRP